MINTCMSPEFRAKVETEGFGVNIMPEDAEILADAIEDLYENEEKRQEMGLKEEKLPGSSLTVRSHIRRLNG